MHQAGAKMTMTMIPQMDTAYGYNQWMQQMDDAQR
jgi:hypothetical protein